MSIEAAILDNTAALREVAAILARLGAMPALPPASAPKPQAAPASAAPTAPTSPIAEAAAVAAPATKVEASDPPPILEVVAGAPDVTYDDVKRAIIEVSKAKGRDAAVALLAEFDATKGPDLQATPEKFLPFINAAARVLA